MKALESTSTSVSKQFRCITVASFFFFLLTADSLNKHEHNLHMPFTGGLGGFGLELADWLVIRGARKLVLSSRSGVRTGYQSLCVRTWRSYGATVAICLADITTKSGVRALLSEAHRLGQVDAIFNLAMVSIIFVHIYTVHNSYVMKC
jgi:hypothetical protein